MIFWNFAPVPATPALPAVVAPQQATPEVKPYEYGDARHAEALCLMLVDVMAEKGTCLLNPNSAAYAKRRDAALLEAATPRVWTAESIMEQEA